jgi:hypothetical protein
MSGEGKATAASHQGGLISSERHAQMTRRRLVRIVAAAMESEPSRPQPASPLPRWTVETTRVDNGTYRIRVSDGLGRSAVGFGRDAQAVVQQCVNAAMRQPGCSYTVVDGSIA